MKKGEHEIVGLIGEGVKMEGVITFPSIFRIEGFLKGRIEKSGHLVVGEKGRVEGEIDVSSLTCYGSLDGHIKVKGRLEIKSKGHISGEIIMESPLLIVEEGGEIEGTLTMQKGQQSKVTPISEAQVKK